MAHTLRYTTPDRVARYLGASISDWSAGQVQEAEALIAAAEAWIDTRQGQAAAAGVIVDEAYYGGGRHLYLYSTPIASVESVTARYYSMADTPDTELVLGTDYEVRSLTSGHLYMPGGHSYDRVLVSYTTTATIPATIETAATMLAAHWLQQASVGGVGLGVQSYTVGQELSVTFAQASAQYGVPVEVVRLVPVRVALA